MVDRPIKFTGAPRTALAAPPRLGEQARKVRAEEAGYFPQTLDALERVGAIPGPHWHI